jgi:hypothetical protein
MKLAGLLFGIALVAMAAPAWAQATASRLTTSDGRPLASSLPPKATNRPRVQVLKFEQLAGHVGDYIELTTIYGVRRQGHVDEVRGQTLRLRVSAGAGHAVVNVERALIREVLYFN